ncbi:MAG: sigma-70 family RNA polymerase sigma factor [Gemmataceae bacterium]|nr:sigma-70 family RNA polymerase sigma factor [Gemmataceae bacterium]
MRPVSPQPPPDGEDVIVARAVRGDGAALDELFRRHRDHAYRVAYRLLGNSEDALDALQEGFIKALTHLHGFERRSSFKTWLLRVVSNAALDLGRQRRRREKLSADATSRATSESGSTPEHADPCREAEESDLRNAVADALMMLPESQRRTFVLHVDGGMSYREVAETMGISIGTVMSRLFYARQKLRGILASRVQA